MAQRTVCLCDGKYIGIETIYTVVDGRQINIPEKLRELRIRSRNNELFCPCGCGSNLILVAGDKNLREQHFRLKDGQSNAACTAVTESRTSLNSKIVLKCWLDEKLKAKDIETRVPIHAVDSVERRYEFSFLSREKKIALSYCRDRANLSDEKFDILESNSRGISVIYVVDRHNGGGSGQYPEGLMKIQSRQGYCLLLDIMGKESDPSQGGGFGQEKARREKNGWKLENSYERASLEAVFYAQDIDGLWQEISIASGKPGEFDIDETGEVLFSGKKLRLLKEGALYQLQRGMEAEKKRRQAEQERQAAYLRELQEEERKRQEQEEKRREELQRELEEQQRLRKEAEEQRRKLYEEERRRREEEEAKRLTQARQREEDFRLNMESGFAQQERQIRDSEGNRWIKCELCGKIAKENEFATYGGPGRINLGTCKECAGRQRGPRQTEQAAPELAQTERANICEDQAGMRKTREAKKKNPGRTEFNICPQCGGRLVERSGKYGKFMGCSNYPDCRYSRKLTGQSSE